MNKFGFSPKIIIFDAEYTAWEGSVKRDWSGANEYREIVQIGALLIETRSFSERDSFCALVKPKLNPMLSDYFINLTGITQESIVKEGLELPAAMETFYLWSRSYNLYSFGRDEKVMADNCKLVDTKFPFDLNRFFEMRDVFKALGVEADKFHSGNIIEAFGKKPILRAHDALNDARTIVDGLKELNKIV